MRAQGGGLRELRHPGLWHQPVLWEAEWEAARQSLTCGPLSLCPLVLPQWLGAEECSCQDEVEEEEAQPSPGMQSPQHGENHLLFRSLSPGFCLPLPRQKDGTAAHSRAASQRAGFQGSARPETSSRALVFISCCRCCRPTGAKQFLALVSLPEG